ncbi:hypothetical protein FB2170_15871 [Maribacter sp. HTCC2170]|nr:hypothetical protein FB2170_15871 [Maribacter sp. HTCC2170]
MKLINMKSGNEDIYISTRLKQGFNYSKIIKINHTVHDYI